MVTAIVYVSMILILIGIAIQISKYILRKELGLYDESGGALYKIIRKRCLVIGCRNKAEVFLDGVRVYVKNVMTEYLSQKGNYSKQVTYKEVRV